MFLIGLLLIVTVVDEGHGVRTLPKYDTSISYFAATDFLNALVDVDNLILKGLGGGKSRTSQFPDTTINLNFGFISPLTSGTPLYKITISANGVCYVPGVNLTNGRPNENFLAPLLGAYETARQDSEIAYVTDGSKLTVEWRNMTLRQQTDPGSFTFQMSIDNNGTVWYLYRTIPTNFNATSYTKLTGQVLVIGGTSIAIRDPLTGRSVAKMENSGLDIQAPTGIKVSWKVSGTYPLDDVTTKTITTTSSNTVTTPKRANSSQLSFCAAVFCFSFLMYQYISWLEK